MKTILLFLFTGIFISSYATDLKYNWKAGGSYHFSAVVKDDISTSVMGMEMKEQFTTTTDFILITNSVNPDGSAVGVLSLVNYNVIDSKGNVFASISDIPTKALVSDVSVDNKGNFTFLKKLYLITSAQGNVLAYGKADANSVSVGGQAGNLKVEAYAEFDPKTGSLKAGYSVQEIETTTSVEVKVTEETDMIDVLPYDFLQLLALPEESVNLNDEIKVKTGIYEMVVKVNGMTNGIASLNHKMLTDKSNDMFDSSASGKSGDGQSMFNMNMDTHFEDDDMNNDGDVDFDADFGENEMEIDMDNGFGEDMDMSEMMSGFGSMPGMTSEDQAAIGASKAMAPDMTCDITTKFNYAIGMFDNVSGTVTTNLNTMGMKMNSVSHLTMILNK